MHNVELYVTHLLWKNQSARTSRSPTIGVEKVSSKQNMIEIRYPIRVLNFMNVATIIKRSFQRGTIPVSSIRGSSYKDGNRSNISPPNWTISSSICFASHCIVVILGANYCVMVAAYLVFRVALPAAACLCYSRCSFMAPSSLHEGDIYAISVSSL